MSSYMQALRMCLRHRWTLAGALLCSLLVGALWGGNIGAVVPMVRVLFRGEGVLASLDKGPLPQTYPYPIGVWRIGKDIQFVILGGEVVVDFALRLKSELSGVKTWVAGFSNDVMAYIASRRVLKEGGYEGAGAMIYYGLPTSWAPESEDIIVNSVHEQLKSR